MLDKARPNNFQRLLESKSNNPLPLWTIATLCDLNGGVLLLDLIALTLIFLLELLLKILEESYPTFSQTMGPLSTLLVLESILLLKTWKGFIQETEFGSKFCTIIRAFVGDYKSDNDLHLWIWSNLLFTYNKIFENRMIDQILEKWIKNVYFFIFFTLIFYCTLSWLLFYIKTCFCILSRIFS